MLNLDGAKERLHLIKASVLDEGSFDPVVEGCDGVFCYAVSPVFPNVEDPQVHSILHLLMDNEMWSVYCKAF